MRATSRVMVRTQACRSDRTTLGGGWEEIAETHPVLKGLHGMLCLEYPAGMQIHNGVYARGLWQ